MRKLGRLSATEMEVMQKIWELPTPVTVVQLLNTFEKIKDWKTSTLSTILTRLIEKGFLTKEMHGKVNFYDTNLSLEEYKKHETQNLLTTLYGGNVKNFVATLVDGENITKDDINDLKKWFENNTH